MMGRLDHEQGCAEVFRFIDSQMRRSFWLSERCRPTLGLPSVDSRRGKQRRYLVAYLGGARCDAPPLWPDHEIFFTSDFIWKGAFLPFFSKNCKIQQCLMVFCISKFQKNGQICGFHWTFRSKKCFSFRGLCPPDPPTKGSAPGPAGGSAHKPPL